jgi:hypothetical protein
MCKEVAYRIVNAELQTLMECICSIDIFDVRSCSVVSLGNATLGVRGTAGSGVGAGGRHSSSCGGFNA